MRQRTALSPGGTDPALLAPGSKQAYGTDTRACTRVFCQAPAARGEPCRHTEFIAARVRRRRCTPGAVHAVAQQLPRVLGVRVLAALLVLPLVISGRRRGHQQPGQVGHARLPGCLIGVLDLRGQQGATWLGPCGPGLIRPPDCRRNFGACRALPSAPGMPGSPRRWPATPRPSKASAWGPNGLGAGSGVWTGEGQQAELRTPLCACAGRKGAACRRAEHTSAKAPFDSAAPPSGLPAWQLRCCRHAQSL